MPGGAFLLNSGGGGMADYGGGLTVPVVVTCFMAASGGLIFGYDIGISGACGALPPVPALPFFHVLSAVCSTRSFNSDGVASSIGWDRFPGALDGKSMPAFFCWCSFVSILSVVSAREVY
jgi:hypothetical protein